MQLSSNNSTTTLERHLKSRHPTEYNKFQQGVEVKVEPWVAELQKEKHNLFINWIITDQQPLRIKNLNNFFIYSTKI